MTTTTTPKKPDPKPKPWTKWRSVWDCQLGTVTDRDLAKQLDVSVDLVRQHRTAAGIPPFRRWSQAARDRNEKCREADRHREVVRRTVRRRGTGRKVIEDLMARLDLSVTRVRQLMAEGERS